MYIELARQILEKANQNEQGKANRTKLWKMRESNKKT